MKLIDKPTTDPVEIYDACVLGITNITLAARLAAAKCHIVNNNTYYIKCASENQLWVLTASNLGNDEQIVFADIKKGELKDLYSRHFVGGKPEARKHYDALMMLAPLGKCPLCGFGHASTLDHFLPKSRYPAFSVFNLNLIPACTDCNKQKGFSEATLQKQALHPYFENQIVEDDCWLFAEVIESTPATARFYVSPPTSWEPDLKKRLENHFTDLELARRFAVEAASELAGLADLLENLEGSLMRREHLSRVAKSERRVRKNSWQAALYDAISNSGWFVERGFQPQTTLE